MSQSSRHGPNRSRTRCAARRLSTPIERLILIHRGVAQLCFRGERETGFCALCDIGGEEGTLRWQELALALRIPLHDSCRYTASSHALAVCRGYPSIVAVTLRSHDLLLDTRALHACAGSGRRLLEEIRRSARVRGLALP